MFSQFVTKLKCVNCRVQEELKYEDKQSLQKFQKYMLLAQFIQQKRRHDEKALEIILVCCLFSKYWD